MTQVTRLRMFHRLAIVLLALACGACATLGGGGEKKTAGQRADPWEGLNRKVYSFNETIDTAVLKPVATAYTNVVPQPVRRGVSNFLGNFGDAWSAVNNFMQGKVTNGFQDVIRVGTNTVFGLGGLFDVASEFGLDRQSEDLGQTLGRWGMAPGPYIVWPLFGPSTLRDSMALPLDRAVSPALVFRTDFARAAVFGISVIDERVGLLGATRMLDDIALDKYVFARDAFLQRRQSLVYDGDVPDLPQDDDERYDQPEPQSSAPQGASGASAPEPAATPASAAGSR